MYELSEIGTTANNGRFTDRILMRKILNFFMRIVYFNYNNRIICIIPISIIL